MSRSFQKGLQLNMQLGQTLFAEAASSGQRMPSATERPTDALSAGSSRDAFRQEAERAIKTGAQFQGNLQSSANGAGGKPDGQVRPPNVPGNMQADNKTPSPLR